MKCAVKSRNEKGKVKKTRERGKAEATEQLRARRKESLGSVLSWPVPLYQPHLSHLSTNKTLNNQSIHESRVLGPKRPRQNNQLYSFFFSFFLLFSFAFCSCSCASYATVSVCPCPCCCCCFSAFSSLPCDKNGGGRGILLRIPRHHLTTDSHFLSFFLEFLFPLFSCLIDVVPSFLVGSEKFFQKKTQLGLVWFHGNH